jgi:GMP synthase (glutamine-hydrolysing)
MILIINNHGKSIKNLEKILIKNKIKFKIKDQRSQLENIKGREINGIILGGGGPNLTKKIYLENLRADILSLINFNVPIFGICEGHLMLADFFGAEIRTLKTPNKHKFENITIKTKNILFNKIPRDISAYENHSRYVKKLPSSLILTAVSSKDKVESFMHRSRRIFGVQFHPEQSGSDGERIILNFIKLCSAD